MSEKRTLQRLKDFSQLAENKEVRLLIDIMIDYVSSLDKKEIGFKQEIGFSDVSKALAKKKLK